MRHSLMVIAVACCLSCGGARAVTASAGDLRGNGGVCTSYFFGLFRPIIVACAQVGSPGTLNDDGKTPMLVVKTIADSFEHANSGNWQLTVTDASGKQLLRQMLERRIHDVGACTQYNCIKQSVDVVQVPTWDAGVYNLRFVRAFDTSLVAEMQLTIL